MKTILLLFTSMATCLCFGQGISPTIGFTTDLQANDTWYPEFGGRIGLGVHNVQFDTLPFNFSFNINAQIPASRRNTYIGQIIFDQEGSDEQQLGFARAEFQKTSISFDYDFGYIHQIGHPFATKTFISPYLSVGARMENYRARAHYELYPQDTCHCSDPTKVPINSTWSLGTNLQAGVKFMFYSVGIDVRAGYYMGWSVGNNGESYLPIAKSFHIDTYGEPQFERRSNNFNSGFNFSVNLIFKFQSYNGDHYRPEGLYPGQSGSTSDDDDDDDDDDGGSSSGGSSSCGGGLSPAERGGG